MGGKVEWPQEQVARLAVWPSKRLGEGARKGKRQNRKGLAERSGEGKPCPALENPAEHWQKCVVRLIAQRMDGWEKRGREC